MIPEAAVEENRRMTIAEFLEARIAEDESEAQTTRALAECAAKRAIINEHWPVDPCDAHDAEYRTITCDTVRALAAVYEDHPDYQQDWAL